MSGRIGIYPGTFDPIHPGHVQFAREAMRACALDKIVFMPEPNPRNKQGVTKLLHRSALIALATSSDPGLEILELKSERFTIRGTLPKLCDVFGGAHLTFLIGTDVAKSLGAWDGIVTLLARVSFAVGVREGDDLRETAALMESLSQECRTPVDFTLVSTNNAGMSSSKFRNDPEGLSRLDPAVAQYIREQHLYTDSQDFVLRQGLAGRHSSDATGVLPL